MEDLNAFLRPKSDVFFTRSEEIMEEAIKTLRKELGCEVRILGNISAPASPTDEYDATEYNVAFFVGDATAERLMESVAGVVAEAAFRLADSDTELWAAVQEIANKAHEHVKALHEGSDACE